MRKNKDVEAIKSFIVKRMNSERDEHAELLDSLDSRLSGFAAADDAKEFLSAMHKFRMKFLQELYDFVQDL